MKKAAILRIIRYIAWAVIIALLFIGLRLHQSQSPELNAQKATDIGGAFALTTTKGETMTEKNFLGKPSILFFGFTSCPDVCPTTLADMTQWLEALGPDADKINAAFITVDPERDTQQKMADYLAAFDKHIIGLTGSREQVDAAIGAFHIFAKRTDTTNGAYTVDHTATVYLFGTDGKLISTIDHQEYKTIAIAKIRKAMEQQPN